MTSHPTSTRAEELACEARRYLDVVETFAVLGADPHASARKRTARKRHNEERSQQLERKGVRKWTH
jgi:hypothetical protein